MSVPKVLQYCGHDYMKTTVDHTANNMESAVTVSVMSELEQLRREKFFGVVTFSVLTVLKMM